MQDLLLEGLQPPALWRHFLELSRIPRCSGQEAAAREYVLAVADRKGCPFRVDEAGNVVVRKAPSPGLSGRPAVVVQSHLDMVCEKNTDSSHDFSRDPIRWRREGDWLGAEGTTLGADNGIGAAAQLALIEEDGLTHGPLELLFTVEEETGLHGAAALDPSMLSGRTLINLDSETEGTFYIGCAGGQDTDLVLEAALEPCPEASAVSRIQVGGLQGGHSGVDIHRERGNAIRILARFLAKNGRELGIRIAVLEGGSKRNAIPRECRALVRLPPERLTELEERARAWEGICRDILGVTDPGLFVRVEGMEGTDVAPRAEEVLRPAVQERLLDLLCCLPHGVLRRDPRLPELVQTSTNLAAVRWTDQGIRVTTNQRSSVAAELEEAAEAVAAAGRLAGARARFGGRYPGWRPNLESPLLALAKRIYRSLFGGPPKVTAIHAGLECGIIGDRIPDMDMISLGPTIEGAHSPDERVEIPSVARFWLFLTTMLDRLGEVS